jgi:hypothetical protein
MVGSFTGYVILNETGKQTLFIRLNDRTGIYAHSKTGKSKYFKKAKEMLTTSLVLKDTPIPLNHVYERKNITFDLT